MKFVLGFVALVLTIAVDALFVWGATSILGIHLGFWSIVALASIIAGFIGLHRPTKSK